LFRIFVFFIDSFGLFVYVAMSFVDDKPTSKQHCSSDILDILVDTSLSFVLGLSFLVEIGNPSIDLQSFALAPLMLFFNTDLGLVVDCYLPWLIEGCHVCVAFLEHFVQFH